MDNNQIIHSDMPMDEKERGKGMGEEDHLQEEIKEEEDFPDE